jgi:hypothetical protein
VYSCLSFLQNYIKKCTREYCTNLNTAIISKQISNLPARLIHSNGPTTWNTLPMSFYGTASLRHSLFCSEYYREWEQNCQCPLLYCCESRLNLTVYISIYDFHRQPFHWFTLVHHRRWVTLSTTVSQISHGVTSKTVCKIFWYYERWYYLQMITNSNFQGCIAEGATVHVKCFINVDVFHGNVYVANIYVLSSVCIMYFGSQRIPLALCGL